MAKATPTAARKGSELAVVEENLPPAVYDYGDDAGAGFEDMGRDDFATPFLYVLQPTSPITMTNDEARPGMLINTVSGELYKAEKAKGAGHEGISFIPVFRQHQLIEWKPRDDKGGGGGFVGVHEVGGEAEQWAKENCKFGDWKTKAGNDLISTFSVYGLIVKPDGSFEQVVTPFTSTKIKCYRHWMTRLKMLRVPGPKGNVTPPIYAHRWRLTTLLQKNDKGQFYIFEVNFDGGNAPESRLDPASEIYAEARSFHELCRDGIAKPNYEKATVDEVDRGGVAGSGGDLGDEVPF